MTALAAVFHRDGRPIDRGALGRVAAALRPFGTAQAAPWQDGPAGLVWIAGPCFVPENTLDDQPVSAGGRLVLFDGVLAHRGDLIDALGLEPRRAAQQADSALFAHAWERWGADAALRAEGQFAAVVWDARARVLCAACSPLHAPPLFYVVDRRRAIVATAPSIIFAEGLALRLDDEVLASSLIGDWGDGRATCYEGVSALLPGEILTVGPKTARVQRYYDLAERSPPVRLPADADYADAADELLTRSVASATRAVETPAIALSGGLDSSALVVKMLDLRSSEAARPVSFTVTPSPGWDGRTRHNQLGDESHRVHALARMYPGLDARFCHGADVDTGQLLPRLVELAQLPLRGMEHLRASLAMMPLVTRAGRNVLLDGAEGNHTLSHHGLARLASLFRAARLPSLLRESAAAPPGRFGRVSPLLHHGLYRNLPRRLHGTVRRLVHGRRGWPDYSAIHPDFARAMRVDERARASGFDPHFHGTASTRHTLLRVWELRATRHMIRSVVRAVEAIYGVQSRHPYFDRRLVEWCLGVPDEQYLRDGQSRRLMLRIMADRLPPEHLNGPRGETGADWHLHATRDLSETCAVLESWRSDPCVAERIDLDRLLQLADAWPQATPVARRDHRDHLCLRYGFDHALAAGRFIRWAEGGSNWGAA